jgi:CheY-like chemotaxis protein
MARRHPLRILLTEDNVVNQKLALRLLAQMGYRADVAANGLEAIDAIERQTYDVVLMDVQMPELDGLEASREINRRWPEERRPRIVAMTANVMQGDRELCAAAGMDDYVSKPIRVDELVAALERCPWRPEAGAPAAAVIDRTAFERLTATMSGEFVAELIDTFVEDGRELLATLRRALAESRPLSQVQQRDPRGGRPGGLRERAGNHRPGREPRRDRGPARAARGRVRDRGPLTGRTPTWPSRVTRRPATSWSSTTTA